MSPDPQVPHKHGCAFICPMNVFFNSNENKVPKPLSRPNIPEQNHGSEDQMVSITSCSLITPWPPVVISVVTFHCNYIFLNRVYEAFLTNN